MLSGIYIYISISPGDIHSESMRGELRITQCVKGNVPS